MGASFLHFHQLNKRLFSYTLLLIMIDFRFRIAASSRGVRSYGHRSDPFGLQAKLSYDKGLTWSEPIVLTDDGFEWDLGYSATVELPDGTMYTVYYQKLDPKDRNTCIMGAHWKF